MAGVGSKYVLASTTLSGGMVGNCMAGMVGAAVPAGFSGWAGLLEVSGRGCGSGVIGSDGKE